MKIDLYIKICKEEAEKIKDRKITVDAIRIGKEMILVVLSPTSPSNKNIFAMECHERYFRDIEEYIDCVFDKEIEELGICMDTDDWNMFYDNLAGAVMSAGGYI